MAKTIQTSGNLTLSATRVNVQAPLRINTYTAAERDALANLATGDLIYNSTASKVQFYITGTGWVDLN